MIVPKSPLVDVPPEGWIAVRDIQQPKATLQGRMRRYDIKRVRVRSTGLSYVSPDDLELLTRSERMPWGTLTDLLDEWEHMMACYHDRHAAARRLASAYHVKPHTILSHISELTRQGAN